MLMGGRFSPLPPSKVGRYLLPVKSLAHMGVGAPPQTLPRLLCGGPALAHVVHKCVEERAGVVGPWGRLRMVLDREDRPFPVAQSLDRLVVQIDVSHLERRSSRNPVLVAAD